VNCWNGELSGKIILMDKNANPLSGLVITILSLLIAVALFLWKIIISPQQPPDQADQYQNNLKSKWIKG